MTFGSNPIAVLDQRALIYVGDVLFWLRQMADDSVDCVVTSPPYWGLRDYDTAVWVDGDPRCDHELSRATRTSSNRIKGVQAQRTIAGYSEQRPAKFIGGYCPKCGARRHDYQIGLETSLGEHLAVMVEVFEEIRRVLKPTGTLWLNYGDCYAAEPNGRSADAAKAAGHDDRRFRDKPIDTRGPIYQADRAHAGARSNGPMKAVSSKVKRGQRNNPSYNAAMMSRERVKAHRRSENIGIDPRHAGHVNHTGLSELGRGQGRLLRNFEPLPPRHDAPLPVWPMASAPFKDAHFATFPPELAERCILAGCPPGGVVLDPFGGSGTTALVALRLGRRAEMIELKPGYAEMAQRRIELDWMGEDEARRARAKAKGPAPDPGPLFSEAAE